MQQLLPMSVVRTAAILLATTPAHVTLVMCWQLMAEPVKVRLNPSNKQLSSRIKSYYFPENQPILRILQKC